LETQPSTENKEQEEAFEEVDEDAENIQENVEMPQPTLRRSTWVINPPKRYEDYISSISLISNEGEPCCYQEAMDGIESAKWKIAMKEEMDALEKNKTWDLVELPKGRKSCWLQMGLQTEKGC
jgi:hypothetical protein